MKSEKRVVSHPAVKYSPYACVDWLVQNRDDITVIYGACIMKDGTAHEFHSPMEHRDAAYLSKIIEIDLDKTFRGEQ